MPPVSVAQVLPNPDVSAAAVPMEAEVDACLTGDFIIDPIVPEESVPVLPEAESSATQALPSPVVSSGSPAAMEEDVDACLTGASVIDPVVQVESVPVLAVVEPSAAPALVDDANASPQSVVEDDNAASEHCPSLPFFDALSTIQDDSLAHLLDDTSDAGTSFMLMSYRSS